MKTTRTWNFGSIIGKLMMGLVLAAMIGSINMAQAIADDHKNMGKHDNGRYEQRGRGHDRDRGRRVYRSPVRRGPVYAPPRVVYEPPPPPGISIFFPPIVIRP